LKTFRFRLATLRKLRELRRDELRSKLAEAHHAIQLLEDQMAHVRDELVDLLVTQRSAIDNTRIDINGLLAAERYQSVLRMQQATMQDQVKLLDTEVERRRQAVVEADIQVRVLDKLEERQRTEHRKKLQQIETKELDEIGSQRAEV
jgi:flagellar FliJ protein